MKKMIVALLAVAAIVATIPLWGSCNLNARLCTTWCNVKHFNSDVKAAGCRARCSMDSIACHREDAAQGINDFMEGLKGR